MRRIKMYILLILTMITSNGFTRWDNTTTAQKDDIYDNTQRMELVSDVKGSSSYEKEIPVKVKERLSKLFDDYGKENNDLTSMEALDKVKQLYASNFEKVSIKDSLDYYYKLPDADYYLYYEGMQEDGKDYLIHLYEFVLDEPETGIGHTVTYGWFLVEKSTGAITANTWF